MSCCNDNTITRNELISLVNKSREAAECAEANCGSSFTNATNAATSATNAANSETAAAASEAAAAVSEANTENLWEQFNALYLGSFAVAPTTDNEGNPLQEGALYWNSVSNTMFAWNGSAWATATNFNEFTNFLATGTTTPRNLVTRTADVANVKDFGAIGNGIADDTAAIQAAINSVSANGGTVFLPRGSYKITSQLNIAGFNICIMGTSQNATKIIQHTLSSKIFNITTPAISFNSLNVEYNSLATIGGDAFYSNQFYGTWNQITVKKAYNAFYFEAGSNTQMLSFIRIEDCLNTGIYIKGDNVLMTNFFILTNNTTNYQLGCIRLENKSEGHVFTSGQTFKGLYALTTDAASYTVFQRPAYCKFTDVYFDSAYYGAWLKNCVEMDFTNCWFSNRPENGLYIISGSGIKFNGGGSINSDKHGVLVEKNAKNISFIGFSARGNSVSAFGTYSGIAIAPDTNNFIVSNCILGENSDLSFGNQKYGLEIFTGTSNNYVVSDNIVLGNVVGGIGDSGSGTNKKIINNIGATTQARGSTMIASGNNSVTFAHNLNFTPLQSDFQLTPTVDLGFCGINDIWISSVTPTQATITANTNATSNAFIAWSVGTRGA